MFFFKHIDYPYKTNKFLLSLEKVLYLYVLINFLTIIFYPSGFYIDSSLNPSWLLGQKNMISYTCFPASIISIINSFRYTNKINFKTWILLFLSLFSIILTKSTTSTISFTILIFYLLLYSKIYKIKLLNIKNYFITSLILHISIVVFRIQYLLSSFIVNILHKNISFTNRTYVWDYAIQLIKNKAILGYGNIESITISLTNYKLIVYHCHNYILQVLLETGIVGLCLLFIYMIYSFYNLYKNKDNKLCKIISLILFCYMIMMITEFFSYRYLLFLLVIGINIKYLLSNSSLE